MPLTKPWPKFLPEDSALTDPAPSFALFASPLPLDCASLFFDDMPAPYWSAVYWPAAFIPLPVDCAELIEAFATLSAADVALPFDDSMLFA